MKLTFLSNRLIAAVLFGLLAVTGLWPAAVDASETHVVCISHDIDGGDLTGTNGTYDIIFDGLCSIMTPPTGSLAGTRVYRAIWQFNVPCPPDNTNNPNVIVEGATGPAGPGFQILGGSGLIVVSAGPDGILQTVPAGDDMLEGTVPDAINAGADGIPDTLVTANVAVDLGADTLQDPTTFILPTGDDAVGVDELGNPAILDGGNFAIESAIHVVITAGPDGTLDSTAGGDDIPIDIDGDGTDDAIQDGGNGMNESTLAGDDVELLAAGLTIGTDTTDDDTLGDELTFTDDIQGLSAGSPPGGDAAFITDWSTDFFTPLAPVTAMYTLDQVNAFAPDEIVCVRLTIETGIDDTLGGATNITQSTIEIRVRLTFNNFAPIVDIGPAPSQPTTIRPGEMVTVNIDESRDEDGYFIWGMVDWGDGTFEELSAAQLALLPFQLDGSGSAIPPHTYMTPGTYSVTLYLIDNGKIPMASTPFNLAGYTTEPTALANAQLALADAIAQTQTIGVLVLPGPDGILDTIPVSDDVIGTFNGQDVIFDGGNLTLDSAILNDDVDNSGDLLISNPLSSNIRPILLNDSFIVTVRPDFTVKKGSWKIKIDRDLDSVKLDLMPTMPLQAPAGGVVTVTITAPGTGATYTAMGNVNRGKFVDAANGMKFKFNERKGIIQIKISKVGTFNDVPDYYNSDQSVNGDGPPPRNVLNGIAEIVVTIDGLQDLDNPPMDVSLTGSIRFTYNSNDKKAVGSSPLANVPTITP